MTANREQETDPADSDAETAPETIPVIFFTSTKKGLGHASRSVAIANALDPSKFAVSIGAYEQAMPFIKEAVTGPTRVEPVDYEFSPTSMPENLDDPQHYDEFVSKNQNWLTTITANTLIITDFVAPAVYLRRYLLEHDLSSAMVIGVYHSFDGVKPGGPDEEKWQNSVKTVVNSLDICFLVELKSTHKEPYLTSAGTLVLPIDPIVRPRVFTNSEVKMKIGLQPNDEYILIQAGMRVNSALWDFVQHIPKTGDEVYVLLGWDLDVDTKERIRSNPRIRVLEAVGFGQDLVAAAKGVIAKPGMQTLSEALASGVPIYLLPDGHPERKFKHQMLKALVGTAGSQETGDLGAIERQISTWVGNLESARASLPAIRGDGAQQVSQYLQEFCLEQSQRIQASYTHPVPVLKTPPGKTAEHLEPAESALRANEIKQEIITNILGSLRTMRVSHTAVLFGGVAKERLRPTSDADLLLVVEPADIAQVLTHFGGSPNTASRAQQLADNSIDSLRIKSHLNAGVELNISLMTPVSYQKIFQPFTPYFLEELGDKISQQPYFVSNFKGESSSVPKVVTVERDGIPVQERRSPGIIRDDSEHSKQTLYGVKHRMLLTSEVLADDFNLGDPTVKLMRGMVRAVLYWNDLYLKNSDGKIRDIKPEAFDANYFFRLLRDPLHMVSQKMQRRIRNLYFNELRRIKAIHVHRSGATATE